MTSPLTKRLAIKSHQSIVLIDAPEGYLDLLGELPEGAHLVKHGPADVVHAFVEQRAHLRERAEAALEALSPGGLLWLSYPKLSSGRSDLSRDIVAAALESHQWRPVTQISIDDTWSALRFRPVADVKSRT